jgi:N-acetylglutamate synthase-like GNAT family acetyltransferase
MKILTWADLPALASIIREATHRKVMVGVQFLHVRRNEKDFSIVTISNGNVLATQKIPSFTMKSIKTSLSTPFQYQILI